MAMGHSKFAKGDEVVCFRQLWERVPSGFRQIERGTIWRVLEVGWLPEFACWGYVLVNRSGLVPLRVPGTADEPHLTRVVFERLLGRIGGAGAWP